MDHVLPDPRPPLPHEHVYVRLGCSKLHGIGVFAIRPIPRGTNIFANDKAEIVWVDVRLLEDQTLSYEVRRLYLDFGIARGDALGVPQNFNLLTAGWYLNEPPENGVPNVIMSANFDFIALNDIAPGDELTTDYSVFSIPEADRNNR